MNHVYYGSEIQAMLRAGTKVMSASDLSGLVLACPRCRASAGMACRNKAGDRMRRAHPERTRKMYTLATTLDSDVVKSFVEAALSNGDRVRVFTDYRAKVSGVDGRILAQADDADLDLSTVLVYTDQYRVLQVNTEDIQTEP
jgi:hypothetical protein